MVFFLIIKILEKLVFKFKFLVVVIEVIEE